MLTYLMEGQQATVLQLPAAAVGSKAPERVEGCQTRAKLDKLDAVLSQTSTRSEDAALFAEMLSLPTEGRYSALDLTPEQRRQRTLEALISQVEALTHSSPVLMIFEDVHGAGRPRQVRGYLPTAGAEEAHEGPSGSRRPRAVSRSRRRGVAAPQGNAHRRAAKLRAFRTTTATAYMMRGSLIQRAPAGR